MRESYDNPELLEVFYYYWRSYKEMTAARKE